MPKRNFYRKKNTSLTKKILAKKIDEKKISPKKFPQKNNLEKKILPKNLFANYIFAKKNYWRINFFGWPLVWFGWFGLLTHTAILGGNSTYYANHDIKHKSKHRLVIYLFTVICSWTVSQTNINVAFLYQICHDK